MATISTSVKFSRCFGEIIMGSFHFAPDFGCQVVQTSVQCFYLQFAVYFFVGCPVYHWIPVGGGPQGLVLDYLEFSYVTP